MVAGLGPAGWARFAAEPATLAWAAAAAAAAAQVLRDPAQAHWFRHGGTWFVGVDSLPNGADGRLPGGPPLAGAAVTASGWRGPWHRAQLSVVFPGYPGRDPQESEAAHRFRRDRDAAHLDGILAEGAARRRHVREPHAFVLGIGLTEAGPGASPLVLWEGSHAVLREAFAAALRGAQPGREAEVDVTEAYAAARRRVFETCRRIEVPLRPGEAVLLHRLLLHGTAPWAAGAAAGPEGRATAWFRPPMPGGVAAWLADG
ncbi:MAG: hypothetical protein N2Z62_09410 [Rhodobacteraceae bacterium]|nr:hypothetical protein [Paracoccaceae bacterium]